MTSQIYFQWTGSQSNSGIKIFLAQGNLIIIKDRENMTDKNSVPQDVKELQKNYRKLQRRVYILEQAVEAVLERDSSYQDKFPAFNDQKIRKAIFQSILDSTSFDFIAETGTKWGNTTMYIASTTEGIPIHSSELVRESFLISRERLKHFPMVKLENCDSRVFIEKLSADKKNLNATPFFYLDAHWNDDLPLREEVESIATKWDQFAVLIDDFKVPDDPGYGFDDYGNGNSLELNYLEDTIKSHNLKILFPFATSDTETGSKRGCAVLCPAGEIYNQLKSDSLLIEHIMTN